MFRHLNTDPHKTPKYDTFVFMCLVSLVRLERGKAYFHRLVSDLRDSFGRNVNGMAGGYLDVVL